MRSGRGEIRLLGHRRRGSARVKLITYAADDDGAALGANTAEEV